MKEELRRRLEILREKRIPVITSMRLRSGGMQERLRRGEIARHGKQVKNKIKKIRDKISLIEAQESSGGFSASSVEPLDVFEEPILKRMRGGRGFF